MGLFDRLRGRGRYVAGTTPESAGEAPSPVPEWAGTAPPPWAQTPPPPSGRAGAELSDWVENPPGHPGVEEPDLRHGDPPAYVTVEDIAAAYGLSGLRTEHDPPVDGVVTHTVAASGPDRLEIFVCDHRAEPAMAQVDEDSWRATGPVEELEGLADSAFVTGDGTVFARVGEEWTVQVRPAADWNPPVEQTAELVRRMLGRLRMAPPPSVLSFDGTAAPALDYQQIPPPVTASDTRGRRLVALAVAGMVAASLVLSRVGTSDNGDEGPYDVIAEVAAEPDRRLNSQGVSLVMTGHEAMSPALCPPVEGCETATRADFEVVDHPFTSRTWLMVFSGEEAAQVGAERLRGQPSLLDPDAPEGSLTIVFDPGRFVQLARLATVDATPVPRDEGAVSVMRGLGAISAEAAAVDAIRRSGPP